MKKFKFHRSKDDSDKELYNKIAVVALDLYLKEREKKYHEVAVSALAMYMNSREHKNYALTLAQAALAIYLDSDPDSLIRPMKNYKSVTPVNSAWGNKYFMMRQLPIRKF
jgi:hypothetical protein